MCLVISVSFDIWGSAGGVAGWGGRGPGRGAARERFGRLESSSKKRLQLGIFSRNLNCFCYNVKLGGEWGASGNFVVKLEEVMKYFSFELWKLAFGSTALNWTDFWKNEQPVLWGPSFPHCTMGDSWPSFRKVTEYNTTLTGIHWSRSLRPAHGSWFVFVVSIVKRKNWWKIAATFVGLQKNHQLLLLLLLWTQIGCCFMCNVGYYHFNRMKDHEFEQTINIYFLH